MHFLFTDDLDRAFVIASKGVSGEWAKLYRSLPFFPNRGENNLDEDIDQIKKVLGYNFNQISEL